MTDLQKCPVCKTENPKLNVTCSSCGGYIQDSVASLDLFHTLWMLIESPATAMQRIILAQQKNYIYLLQILFGFAYVSFIFWFANIGLLIDDLQVILALILLLGPFAGITLILVLSIFAMLLIRIQNISISYRNVRAIISYAGFPIIVSVVFVFPAEIGIFGMYLFTNDPSPFTVNPLVYGMILGLDVLFIFWSIALLFIALKVLSGRIKPAVAVTIILIIIALLPVIAITSIVSLY